MREGRLIYDYNKDQYDIRFEAEEYLGGLYCGTCFDVKIKGEWIPTRIELRWPNEWYLVDIFVGSLDGLQVRI